MSSGRWIRVARPAQYTALRSVRPTAPSASVNVRTLSSETRAPAPRSTRPNAVANDGASANGAAPLERLAHQLVQTGLAYPLLVLPVLQHRAERGVHRRL